VNASTKLVSRIVSDHPLAYLTLEPNRGRDILPFIKLLRTIYAEGYSYVCKIHSKKSPQRKDGAALRQAALTALLGEEHSIREIRRRFENNSKLGIVAPADAIVDLSKPDRNVLNRAWLNALLPRIGADELIGKYNGVFVAGSMFWARVAALKPILDLELGSAEFESEAGQVDGTLAHAIERLWSIAAQKIGFVTESIP
jgi:lipopolysaccharide biosynthesis protein